MSRLEDWQLDMLEKQLEVVGESLLYTFPIYPMDPFTPNVPTSWLKPLLEEVRASRASAGGGAEPKDELWEAVRKIGKSLQTDYEKRRCPECGGQDLDPELFMYCNECHEYREVK